MLFVEAGVRPADTGRVGWCPELLHSLSIHFSIHAASPEGGVRAGPRGFGEGDTLGPRDSCRHPGVDLSMALGLL